MPLFGPTVRDEHHEIASDARGESVTPERVAAVDGVMREHDGTPQYIGKGSTVDVDETGSHKVSMFDTSRDIRQATRGYVDAVVTDEGVVIAVPKLLRNEEYRFSYDELSGATIQERSLHHYLVLQTSEYLYHVELYEPDKDEAKEMARYIRHQIDQHETGKD